MSYLGMHTCTVKRQRYLWKGTQETSTLMAVPYFLRWFVGNSSAHHFVPYTFLGGTFYKMNDFRGSEESPRVLLRSSAMNKNREDKE